jgi:hypothetical protein
MHHTSREIQLAQALVEAADTFTDAFEALRQYAHRRRLPTDHREGGEGGGTVGGPA